jgi:sugar phosphate isomerase/epimerase
MKLSSQTEYISARCDDFTAVKMICEAGFDAIDYSMFAMQDDDNILNTPAYKEHVLELKKLAESYGKHFNQAHAPFPTIRVGDDKYNETILPKIKRAIEIAGLLEVENIVVHPVFFEENKKEKNIEMYLSLLEDAKAAGVKIALENMFGKKNPETGRQTPNVCSLGEEFADFYDALPSEYFSCCVDIGHCALVGDTPENILRIMGDRVACLHVHDNDTYDDWHFPPFTLDLNWTEIAKALADINYQGYITLEADNILADIPTDLYPAMLNYMYQAAKKVGDMVDGFRK